MSDLDEVRQTVAAFKELRKKLPDSLRRPFDQLVTQVEQRAADVFEEARSAAAAHLAHAEEEAQAITRQAREAAGHETERSAAAPHDTGRVAAQETHRFIPYDAGTHREYPLHTEQSDTLVVHCSDPRFQEAFRMFLREELGLAVYDPLVVPGATQLLTFGEHLPKFSEALLRPLKFLVKGHKLTRVVAIMHEDCAWYHGFVPKFARMHADVKTQQVNDLLAGKRILAQELPGIPVDLFYASITQDHEVTFSEITETARVSR